MFKKIVVVAAIAVVTMSVVIICLSNLIYYKCYNEDVVFRSERFTIRSKNGNKVVFSRTGNVSWAEDLAIDWVKYITISEPADADCVRLIYQQAYATAYWVWLAHTVRPISTSLSLWLNNRADLKSPGEC